MTRSIRHRLTPRMKEALDELKGMIAARFPQATFAIQRGFEPEGIYLLATVDIEDTDEVIDIVGDRLVDLQVEDGLAIYVTPLQPLERVLAQLREQQWRTLGPSLPREWGSDEDEAPRSQPQIA